MRCSNEQHISSYTEQISQEIELMSKEYLPMLLEIIRLFRQTVVAAFRPVLSAAMIYDQA